MILTFIGMSGAGKSYWSGKCASQGFTVFDCDALIAAELEALVGPIGLALEDVGRWMGFPYQSEFPKREALYLASETNTLRSIISQLEQAVSSHTNYVIDTSGSVIYTDPALLQRLRKISTIVYFRVAPALHQQMLQAYLDNPRPVLWNGLFEQTPAETLTDAFRRCYIKLLHQREALYEQLSDITLDHTFYRRENLSVNELIAHIQTQIAQPSVAERPLRVQPAIG